MRSLQFLTRLFTEARNLTYIYTALKKNHCTFDLLETNKMGIINS